MSGLTPETSRTRTLGHNPRPVQLVELRTRTRLSRPGSGGAPQRVWARCVCCSVACRPACTAHPPAEPGRRHRPASSRRGARQARGACVGAHDSGRAEETECFFVNAVGSVDFAHAAPHHCSSGASCSYIGPPTLGVRPLRASHASSSPSPGYPSANQAARPPRRWTTR